MQNIMDEQLKIIEESIEWIKKTSSMQGTEGDNAYDRLVNYRRKLKKKKTALENGPAAAVFGQSQVGKSYLIDALLSEKNLEGNKPFTIYDTNGNPYGFKKDMNPQGGGSESTGLVSRFSVQYKPVNQNFPIGAKLLSPADLVLILCDSYYSDINVSRDKKLKQEDIDEVAKKLKNKFQERPIQQKIFCEDDVLNIKEYVYDKAGNLSDLFFKEVSLFIEKVKLDEWKEIFSLFWNENEKFTNLFSELINEYQALVNKCLNSDFTDTLYLPLEAVLYKHGTLLDVARLKEIYETPTNIESDYKDSTSALVIVNGEECIIGPLKKSYLCALLEELVFNVPESLLENKTFLKDTDLLDFPGARGRKTTPEKEFDKMDVKGMWEFLLRGKVAYLFNKYSNFEKINILLFCAKHEQPAERAMPEVLDPLISKIIGNSPEEREKFIKESIISPLFIIGTYFNVNLEYGPKDEKIDEKERISALNYRWDQRFERSLKELIDTKTYSWFEDWTISQKRFKNIFLLRDFEHSTKIFEGYSKKHPKEIKKIDEPKDYPNFSDELRKSFIDFVKTRFNHFEDPEESWDEAANKNKDGTDLIIKKLATASNNINIARNAKIKDDIKDITNGIIKVLRNDCDYKDDNADKELENEIRKAGLIQARLALAFDKNFYFFGPMIDGFMLNQPQIKDLYCKKLDEIGRRNAINMKKYIGIFSKVSFNPNKKDDKGNETFSENLERLCNAFEFNTSEECKEYFEKEGIDLDELFYGTTERVKTSSQVLADRLIDYYFGKEENINDFGEHIQQNRQSFVGILTEDELQNIQIMFKSLVYKLKIRDVISENIKRYVDGYRNIEEVYETIADISTEIINKFINSVGKEYYKAKHFDDLKNIKNKGGIVKGDLCWEHNELEFEKNCSEEVAKLITDVANSANLLRQNPMPIEAKRFPYHRSYIIWSDLLKVGFVTASGELNCRHSIGDNAKLGKIIKKVEALICQ